MARIKITGYINTEGYPAEAFDLEHSTGFSAEGHEQLIAGITGDALSLADLDDVATEVEKA